MFTNIIDQFNYSVEQYKDNIAFTSPADNPKEASSITFKDLEVLVKRIATGLLGYLGEQNQPQPIGVMTDRNYYTPACYMGIALTGNFYAPMDPTLPETRILQILSVAKPRYIITDQNNFQTVNALTSTVDFEVATILLEDLLKVSPDEEIINQRKLDITEDSPLYMIFTSGSTGVPKGVLTSHLSLMCYLDGLNQVIQLEERDVIGSQAPFDYIAAIRDLYLPLVTGCSTVIIPRTITAMPKELFSMLNEYKVTTLCWSAAGLEVISKLGAFDDPSLSRPEHIKRIVFSGSVIPNQHLEPWQDALPDTTFINQYGPTETTASCTYYILRDKVSKDTVIPIGKPFQHYQVLILDEDNKEAAYGSPGELCVAGPALAIGYYNNPEQTEKVFVKNPLSDTPDRIYRTGDLAKYDNEGNLLFLGRKDRQIKHMGHRIELAEIDRVASSIPQVSQGISIYDPLKEILHLFYTGEASKKDITLFFRKNMPSYMVPRKITNLESFPTLPNGKINMGELKKMI
ncbi:MAG: amino acid adenylation domain-containing protein [Firmicutes bacterium]|nr:amino acid adenylation domain-containing protein [Bacillota bacterium]